MRRLLSCADRMSIFLKAVRSAFYSGIQLYGLTLVVGMAKGQSSGKFVRLEVRSSVAER
jgi:hypothetical protein